MSLAKRMAGQSAFFLVGNVFTLLVGLVFQVYLAKHLGAGGLGVYGLLESGVGIATSLLGFGIAQAAVRYIPSYVQHNENRQIHALIYRSFKYLGLSGALGVSLFFVFIPLTKPLWPELAHYQTEMLVMSLLVPLGLVNFLSCQILRGFFDVVHIVIGSTFIQLTLKVVATILLFTAGMQVLGYVWAVVISTLAGLLWMLWGIKSHLKKYPQAGEGRNEIDPAWKSYAKVMYGNSLVSFWAAPLDRFLLAGFIGANAVGVLMVVKVIYSLPGIFLQMFLAIVAPMLSSAHAKNDIAEINHVYQLCTDWLVRISLPLIIFLAIFSKPVLLYFGKGFADSGAVALCIFLFAQFVSLICGPIGNVLNMCGLEREMFRIRIVSSVLGAVVLVALVPWWGLNGVGISVLLEVAYANFAALYVAKRKLKINWWNHDYVRWFIPTVAAIVISLLIDGYESNPGIVELGFASLAVYGVFFLAQIVCHGMNDHDREIFVSVRAKLSGFGNK